MPVAEAVRSPAEESKDRHASSRTVPARNNGTVNSTKLGMFLTGSWHLSGTSDHASVVVMWS
jgi:hypothetical protein